jgi:Bacterial mobilisation protein (MobC).
MANRTRPIVLRCPVSEQERELILQKMEQIPTKNFAAYARKMLIDGHVIVVDYSELRAVGAEIQKIGVNINQIAKRANATGNVYEQDIAEIKGVLAEIWRLQRLSLLKAP